MNNYADVIQKKRFPQPELASTSSREGKIINSGIFSRE